MFKKGTKAYSSLHLKCPRCQEGDLFITRNPYVKMGAMPEHCPHCGLRYQLEPSFFFGAMYVSYALTVGTFIATWIVMEWIYDPSMWELVAVLLAILIPLGPPMFRFSRAVWLNMFVRYAPEKRGAENR